jgi:two-component system, NtrC family, nitrogen regulation sensor histidine kinase NtrY
VRRRLRSQNRMTVMVLLAALPGLLIAALWVLESMGSTLRWLLLAGAVLLTIAVAFSVRRRLVSPLQSMANLLEALRAGDYSQRGRNADPDDAFGEVMIEVNKLSSTLHAQRLQALEADMLLNKIVAEIDIAVLAFDQSRELRMANAAAVRLLGTDVADLIGSSAGQLGLDVFIDQPSRQIIDHAFPGGAGRWEIRHRTFREGGLPHELLVISDLSYALREEERQTWRRLVRVIGHELNNSLAPIRSIAGTLSDLVKRDPLPPDWLDDTEAGLNVIRDRADSLGRLMSAYARLARLPAPRREQVNFADIVTKSIALVGRDSIHSEEGPPIELLADPDQMEQVLINLFKNALEAAGDQGAVRVRWREHKGIIEAEIEDDGPGLAKTENLWVPFFTTKPGGSGIGLVLSREIIENHGGSIALANRTDSPGCVARICIPIFKSDGDLPAPAFDRTQRMKTKNGKSHL